MATKFEKVYKQVLPNIESQTRRWEYNFLRYCIDRGDLRQEALMVLSKILKKKGYRGKDVNELARIFVVSMMNKFRNMLKHHKRMEQFTGPMLHPDGLEDSSGNPIWGILRTRKNPTALDGVTVNGIEEILKEALPKKLRSLFKDMMRSYANSSKWGTPFRIGPLAVKYHVSKQMICKRIKKIREIATEVLGENDGV